MAGTIYYYLTGCALVAIATGGCVEDLNKDNKYGECYETFEGFYNNTLKGMPPNQNRMANLCTGEGKAAMTCLYDYIAQCPDLASSTDKRLPGLNLEQMKGIAQKGGIELTCELEIGPCSKFKECIRSMPRPNSEASGMRTKREGGPPESPYQIFQSMVQMICEGHMEETVSCLVKALGECSPSAVQQVDEQFWKEFSQSGGVKIPSLKDTMYLKEKQCPNMPPDFGNHTCLAINFVTGNFTQCYQNITKKSSEMNTCGVYFGSHDCVDTHLRAPCGNEYSDFLNENTQLIFPSVPRNCKPETSTASSNQAIFVLTAVVSLLTTVI